MTMSMYTWAETETETESVAVALCKRGGMQRGFAMGGMRARPHRLVRNRGEGVAEAELVLAVLHTCT
jgi:hypothetical protein